MCLFLSLPASYENIIDNLSTKVKLQYADVNNRLLDLSTSKSSTMSSATSKAYSTSEVKPQKGGKRECTWCKKHGGRYEGHYHTECRQLKAHLENNSSSKGKGKERASTMKNEKAYQVTEISFPNETSDITFPEFKAFSAVSSRPSPSHCILDSGASSHISSRKELFASMSKFSGSITSAGNIDYPICSRGKVHLDIQISTGKVICATLEDVLYVPQMTGNLISESMLERKGFQIVSEFGRRLVFKNGKE